MIKIVIQDDPGKPALEYPFDDFVVDFTRMLPNVMVSWSWKKKIKKIQPRLEELINEFRRKVRLLPLKGAH